MAGDTSFTPSTAAEVAQIVREAAAEGATLRIVGGGTKRTIGNPSRQTRPLSMRNITGIVDYDPAELVMTVRAGTSLAEMERQIAAHHQMLAFEPCQFATETLDESSTIGGVVAAGLAGPRRISAGNVRDHVLGFTAVSGRGEEFTAGGRVVKNVTGYDLPKLLSGSWGQLAVLTEITLKVLPRPRMSLTLQVRGLDDGLACEAMTRALRSSVSVSAAAYFPQSHDGGESLTLFRLEGFEPSVQVRSGALAQVIGLLLEPLDESVGEQFWKRLRRGAQLTSGEHPIAWRLCIPRVQALLVCAELRALKSTFVLDWAGALLWVATASNVAADAIRAIAANAGGHATLIDAPDDFRRRVPALHPASPGVSSLSLRIKAMFDPQNVLDPQRFVVSA